MTDGFSDPSSLFEEFEREPVSSFGNGGTEGDRWDDNDDDAVNGDGSSTAPTSGAFGRPLFHTPKELLEEAPGIQLTFLNHPKIVKHRSAIELFFAQLLSRAQDDDDDDVGDAGDGISSVPKPLPTAIDLAPSGCKRRRTDHEASVWRTTGCMQLYPEFMLDAHGQPLVQLTHELTLGWDVPPFERLFEKHIPLEEEEGLVPKGNRRGRSCFNCGDEGHPIADCPLPKNMKEIQRRKAEIRKQNNVPTLSGNKATLDVSVDPRFKSFKPGVISEELSSALGADDRKLPPWIYRMRVLGYPPGWLEEAVLTHSGLTMYEGDGGRLRSDGLRFESGEVEELHFEEAKEFQLAKLVEYPGFNASPPNGVTDESRRYQVPPFDRKQSLELMRSNFARRNEELKRRLGVSSDDSSGEDGQSEKKRRRTIEDRRAEEMDLSSGEEARFRPPLPPGAPPPPTPPAPLPSSTPPSTPGSRSSFSTPPPSSRRGVARRLSTYPSTDDDASSVDDGPPSSRSSNSDGQSEEESDGIIVEDEMEDGEMPRTPPEPSPAEEQVTEISCGDVSAGVPPPSSPPPNDAAPPFAAPTTPANQSLSIATPTTPSVSLNSISVEHSTPVPSRFDVSDFLDDGDDGDEVDDDDDDGGDDDIDADASPTNAADGGAPSTPVSAKRRRKFIVTNPSVNPTMPTPDQWAKNVSEHMDFENLPNTEGRFIKIKEIAERRKKYLRESKTL